MAVVYFGLRNKRKEYLWAVHAVQTLILGMEGAAYFLMHVHLVFVTRCRRGVFTKEIIDDLRVVFASVCRDFEAELVEFDGEDDHVHLLVNYPPKIAVSALVNSLKGVSSRMIRQKNYPTIRRRLWGGALWSPSYFAGSCGGAPIAVVRQYMEQQKTPH